jgi:hypothetical protein
MLTINVNIVIIIDNNMSHFTVVVISETPDEVDEKLAPFEESMPSRMVCNDEW